PTLAPRLATASTIRNAEVAVKKAPAIGLLNCLVTRTVTPRVVAAETPAPIRFSVPPRATSASWAGPPLPGRAGPPGRCVAAAGLPFLAPAGGALTLPSCAATRGVPGEGRGSGHASPGRVLTAPRSPPVSRSCLDPCGGAPGA